MRRWWPRFSDSGDALGTKSPNSYYAREDSAGPLAVAPSRALHRRRDARGLRIGPVSHGSCPSSRWASGAPAARADPGLPLSVKCRAQESRKSLAQPRFKEITGTWAWPTLRFVRHETICTAESVEVRVKNRRPHGLQITPVG